MSAKDRRERTTLLMRIVAPVAMWAIGRVFTIPRVKRFTDKVDYLADQRKRMLAASLRKKSKTAMSNPAWLAAGAAAVAVGAGLMARAGSKSL